MLSCRLSRGASEFGASLGYRARKHRVSRGNHISASICSSEDSTKLRDWFKLHGGICSVPLSLPLDTNGQFRRADGGLVCESEVLPQQELVRVPLSLFMTADTCRRDSEYGSLVTETGLSEWQALILHLLCERAKGENSFWAPYVRTLPSQAQHPLFWGEQQLSWIQASPMLAVLQARQQQILEDTDALLIACTNDLPLAVAHLAATGEELVSPESVRWAAAVLLSRGFSLDLAEEAEEDEEMAEELPTGAGDSWPPAWGQSDTLALVPWADMLRHSSAAVWASFGPNLSPPELLLDYGSVGELQSAQEGAGDQHKFEADAKEIVPARSRRNAALLSALESLQGVARMALGPSGPDVTALTYGRAALASDADLVRAGWRVKATEKDGELACRVMGRLSQPINAANETLLLETLRDYVERRAKAYESRLELSSQGLQQHVAIALWSELRSLEGTRATVDAWLEELATGTPVEDLYPDYFDDGEEAGNSA